MKTRLFVYGTLMQGQANHRLLQKPEVEAELVGSASALTSRWLMVDLGLYPALLEVPLAHDPKRAALAIPRDDHAHARGEVWQVSAAGLAVLDSFEGTPSLYVRRSLLVLMDNERPALVQAYVVGPLLRERCLRGVAVPGGDWAALDRHRRGDEGEGLAIDRQPPGGAPRRHVLGGLGPRGGWGAAGACKREHGPPGGVGGRLGRQPGGGATARSCPPERTVRENTGRQKNRH